MTIKVWKFRPWRRVLMSVASLRRFVRRLSRHMIRIKIIQTLNVRPSLAETPLPAVTPIVAAAPPEAQGPRLIRPVCPLCDRHPAIADGNPLCLACQSMPAYLVRKLYPQNQPEMDGKEAQTMVQAWQDAAGDN